jgi:repressor LexA
MPALTERQREVLEQIRRSLALRGVAPTLQEIADALGFSSTATAQKHVQRLIDKGVLRRIRHQKRGLELVRPEIGAGVVRIPLLGVVAAGSPIEVVEDREEVAVPESFVGPGPHFVLRVRGDSMIGDGVFDGDLIVVERRDRPSEGDMVVALVDGEVTLKRFFPAPGGSVRLQPANPALDPLVVPASSVTVQGVVRALLRRYA